MAGSESIPSATVRRLSLYLRQLETLKENDRRTTSSRQLGDALGLSPAQIRKDLAYFGQFGHPGIGYRVEELILRLRKILGTDKRSNVLLVGFGNLGRALTAYRGFNKRGFELVAVFDNNPELIGTQFNAATGMPITIQHNSQMAEAVRLYSIKLGILTVPAEQAEAVARQMVDAGVRGILNFAPLTLHVDPAVPISYMDLAVHLEQLSFRLSTASALGDECP